MTGTGTQARFYIDLPAGYEGPVEGDFWRSDPGGSCYLIDQVRANQNNSRRNSYLVTRLGKDAVAADDPGVHLFHWNYRRRRR